MFSPSVTALVGTQDCPDAACDGAFCGAIHGLGAPGGRELPEVLHRRGADQVLEPVAGDLLQHAHQPGGLERRLDRAVQIYVQAVHDGILDLRQWDQRLVDEVPRPLVRVADLLESAAAHCPPPKAAWMCTS
ncbi:hypothetical protein SY2F82_65770 [Streptomyces sp. Y2F8-2]|nr:hypothetical protein SY2F82_65770 [Streptomyces sp. Y2F8-2]